MSRKFRFVVIKTFFSFLLHFSLFIIISQASQINYENQTDDYLPLGFMELDISLTFGFSGNISQATTSNHNQIVACTMYSKRSCNAYLEQTGENFCPQDDFDLTNLTSNLCTHFLYVDTILEWWLPTGYSNPQNVEGDFELLDKLSRLKNAEPEKTKTLLQIRHGPIEDTQGISTLNRIAKLKKTRERFINNTLNYLLGNNFDGLDVVVRDFGLANKQDVESRRHIVRLIPILFFELREAFKPLGLQLTLTFYQNDEIIHPRQLKWIGLHFLMSNVDQIHLFSILPLHLRYFELRPEEHHETDVKATLKYIVEDFKISASRVILGIFFAGIPTDILDPLGNDFLTHTLSYPQICELSLSNVKGWTRYYSPYSEVSIIKNETTTIMFESPKSITRKILQNIGKGIGGFAIDRTFNDDYFGNVCGTDGVSFPLLRTINSALATSLSNPGVIHSATFTKNILTRSNRYKIKFQIKPTREDKIIKCDFKPNFMADYKEPNEEEFPLGSNFKQEKELKCYLCTHLSIGTIMYSFSDNLEVYFKELRQSLQTKNGDEIVISRYLYPDLKLTLSLILYDLNYYESNQSTIYKTTYPFGNRRKFINSVIKGLMEAQLDGIEITVLSLFQENTGRRTKSLFTILLHELKKQLSILGLTLGLTVGSNDKATNYQHDLTLLNMVDHVNVVPHVMEEWWNKDTIGHFNLLNAHESINYFLGLGVPPGKLIVGTLDYAMRMAGGRYQLVPVYETCLAKNHSLTQWTQSSKDSFVLNTSGAVTYVFESEDKAKSSIQAVIDLEVKGFIFFGMNFDRSYCSRDNRKYWTLRVINSLLNLDMIKRSSNYTQFTTEINR